MSNPPNNEKLLDFSNSPTLSFSPSPLPSPFTDFKGMQSPTTPNTIQLLGTPDQSKAYFLPTGFDYACESAEQDYKAKYGTIPKIGKAPRDAQRLQGKITPDEIKTVQKYIEKCLQLYMSPSEVVAALQQAEIDPGFTSIVWDKLTETNEPFFKAYGVMLRVKEQIMAFNYLISQQAQLMQTNRLGFYNPENSSGLLTTPPSANNPFAGTVLPSLSAPSPVAPAITVPRDILPPDDDDDDDSDEEFSEKPKPKKKKTTKKAAKPKSPKPPKTKAKRGKAATAAPVAEPPPTTPLLVSTPSPVVSTPGTPIQLVPITSPAPTLLFPAPGQRPASGSILVVNSPNFPPTQPPKGAPRQIASSGVPVVTNRGVPPILSPIPVISAKPGTAPTTATVSIKPKPPVPIVQTIVPNRPQVKPPSQLQMPVITKAVDKTTTNTEAHASDLDTNVFLNE